MAPVITADWKPAYTDPATTAPDAWDAGEDGRRQEAHPSRPPLHPLTSQLAPGSILKLLLG